MQYSLGFQQELTHTILVEASYASIYQDHVNTKLKSGRWSFADNAQGVTDNTYLNLRMPNPFYGIIPNRGIGSSSSINRSDLLRPDPLFPDIKNNLVQDGRYRPNALQAKI